MKKKKEKVAPFACARALGAASETIDQRTAWNGRRQSSDLTE